MRLSALKYLSVFVVMSTGMVSMFMGGWWTFMLPVYAFGLLPLVDWLMLPDHANATETELQLRRKDVLYDIMVWLAVPLQYTMLIVFLFTVNAEEDVWYVTAGKIISMGVACGVVGINVGHELGHRANKPEQLMAKALLLTSLYMHFFIEHNRGHHKNVSTDEDPSSAKRGEMVYTFWFRTITQSLRSASDLEAQRLRKKKLPVFSLHNEMLRHQLMHAALVITIGVVFGPFTMLCFLAAAFIGILLLETVNYIEHYGLRRRRRPDGRWEDVLPVHSWNSDHIVGRIMLFELSRHSDHHYRPGKKYQLLKSIPEAPHMPAGYPAMIVLSLFPPLWFWVMNRTLDQYKSAHPKAATVLA